MKITVPTLGIDIAKEKFDVALLLPAQQQPLQKEFANNATGRKKLLKWLSRNSAGPCLAGMEATGCYGMPLLLQLHEAGHCCHLLQPRMVKNHISARGQRNKTDRQDAIAIADYVVKHEPPQWQPLSTERQEVKELNQVLIELQEDLKRCKNRLAAAPSQKTRYVWEVMVKKITLQMKKLEEEVHQKIMADAEMENERKLYTSISGVGPVLARNVIALVDMSKFAAAKNLCSYAGVSPCNHESGKSVKKAARVAFDCQRQLRRILAQAGIAALSPRASNPALLEFRERLKHGKRQLSGRALAMALGHKLLRIIYGVHKSGKPFQSELAMSRA